MLSWSQMENSYWSCDHESGIHKTRKSEKSRNTIPCGQTQYNLIWTLTCQPQMMGSYWSCQGQMYVQQEKGKCFKKRSWTQLNLNNSIPGRAKI